MLKGRWGDRSWRERSQADHSRREPLSLQFFWCRVFWPINAETWLGIHKNLKKAFPDLDYHFHVDGVDGDVTKISAELKGTHSGALDLSPIGLGVIPATDKSFATPREHGKVTCKGDKVVSWVVDKIEGGGLMGLLNQLGIAVPTM